MVVIKGGAMSAGDMLRDGSMDGPCVINVGLGASGGEPTSRRGRHAGPDSEVVLTVRADMRQ